MEVFLKTTSNPSLMHTNLYRLKALRAQAKSVMTQKGDLYERELQFESQIFILLKFSLHGNV